MVLDVFISYSHKDRPLRDELATHLSNLRRQGLINDWYDGDIAPGTEWKEQILAHLNKAQLILLLISADFMASEFCYSIEMQQAIARHQAKQAHVIPIILRPTDWEGAPFSDLKALPTDGKPVTDWPSHDNALADVMKGLRAAIKELSTAKPLASPANSGTTSMSADQVQLWTVPFQRNPFFTGREETLARIHAFLQAQQAVFVSQPAAISGLGGIGKTQIAIEYAYRYAHEYQFVLWVQADTRDTLRDDYVTLAQLLNLPEREAQDQTIIVEAVKRWLAQNSRWLLIIDNADDLSLVDPFLPTRARGHILYTTRTHLLGGRAARVDAEQMTEEEGTRFVLHRIGMLAPGAPLTTVAEPLRALATTLVNTLDGLPLALDQAGAYIEETGCGLPRYLELYQTQRHILLARRSKQSTTHPEPVATTWSLSFERIEQANPAAAELLRCCAFLHSDAIPEELITKGASHLSPLLQAVARDAVQFDEAVSDLLNYSLLRRLPDTGDLSIHRLVQAVLKDAMDSATQRRWAEHILNAVDQLFTTREMCQRYLPHAMVCYDAIKQWNIDSEPASRLLHKMASYLNDLAQYSEAEPLFQRALTISERVLGPEHPDTAMTLNNLAALYNMQGKHEQAEPLFERALAIAERALTMKEQVLGPEHPDTAMTLNNLAVVYCNLGKYEQAEPLYERALAIQEQVLGPEHPYTAYTLNNLAGLYRIRGKYEQAEPLYQHALATFERALGAEDPQTAISLNNLALLYYNQEKYEQAEPLFQRALAIREHVLGTNHSFTADTLNNLALLYYNQEKYEQAEPLFQRALAIRKRVLGPQHSDTATTLYNLAELHRAMEKNEQVGEKSPDTAQ